MASTDNDLLERIRAGDKRVFAQLVNRYKDRAMTLAVRVLRNREDAEEAVQDSFVRAYNGLEKFEGNAKFSTWFYRIVYNVCLSRVSRRKDNFDSLDADGAFDLPDTQIQNPHQILEVKDLVAILKRTVESLPNKYSTIISLFYFQEMSYEDICAITDLPLGTVKAHLFRARALLQKQLAEQLPEVA